MLGHERIQELGGRLKSWREVSPGQWEACCPAHDDHTPSFHVAIDDVGQKLLVNCKRGCTTQAILGALGWTVSSLFLDPRSQRRAASPAGRSSNGKRHVVGEYSYKDASGVELFQVLRYEPKEFAQRTRIDGQWKYSLKGVRRVLYRLPELLAADVNLPVLLVEGEKKVDFLRMAGFIATCNAGGAAAIGTKSKWTDDYAETLAGRHVVIIPDNDDPGLAHAQVVGKSLIGRAASCRVLRLPGLEPKGDVLDWKAIEGNNPALLKELIREAPTFTIEAGAIESGDICNVEFEAGGDVARPVPMEQILKRLLRATGDWPRRVSDMLFVHEEGRPVSWLDSVPSLFGFVGGKTGKPAHFERRADSHTKEEVYSQLQRRAKEYQAIELFPHEPPQANHYYACVESTVEGNGDALAELVSFFSPATDLDRDLILLLFATLVWGGSPGERPVFLITSDKGTGAGKTKLATVAASLVGGHVELSKDADVEIIKQRLLSSEGVTKRVVILDNIKTLKFSWAELEAMITSRVISGKKMYVGEWQRPNNITWIITLNGASLGRDMAERVITIKLSKPSYHDEWLATVTKFIETRRWEIIADLIAFLRWPKAAAGLKRHSRWSDWEGHVLMRMSDPEPIQREILRRQVVNNVETEESEELQLYFEQRLTLLGYDTLSDCVFIPSPIIQSWYCQATRERANVVQANRIVRQKIAEGTLLHLHPPETRRNKRGLCWVGVEARHEARLDPHDDLEERMGEATKERVKSKTAENHFHWSDK